MTNLQFELLIYLKELGPITAKALYEIFKERYGDYDPPGNRLRTLERSGWAIGVLWSEAGELAYKACAERDRKLWAITWEGIRALNKKRAEYEAQRT